MGWQQGRCTEDGGGDGVGVKLFCVESPTKLFNSEGKLERVKYKFGLLFK